MSAKLASHNTGLTSLDTVARVSSAAVVEPHNKTRLVSLLHECGSGKLARRVSQCHAEFKALTCKSGHKFNAVPTYHCNYRLCPDCARDRQRRSYGRLMPVLRAHQKRYPFDRPVLITLTARSTFEPLAVHDKRFKAWFTKLRRTKLWKESVRGAIAAFEFTWNQHKGWHYHIHILAFRKASWLEQSELLLQWNRITEGAGSAGVDIQSKGSLRSMADEVLKYCFKPADIGLGGEPEKRWTANQVGEFNELRRVKLSESYGSLRGFELDADELAECVDQAETDEHSHLGFGSPCPDCGSPLFYERFTRDQVLGITLSQSHNRAGP